MEKITLRKQAEEIVYEYCSYHAIGAITIGAFGGQFGADRLVLSALTSKMILKICDIYNITDSAARSIHVAAALTRLTLTGTAIAHTILNYIPGGSLVNGGTTFFLTRSAGLKCISEIELGLMNVNDQMIQGAKDVTLSLLRHGTDVCEFAGIETSQLEDIIEESIKQEEVLAESGLSSLVDYLNKLPNEAIDGVNTMVYSTLKASFINALESSLEGNAMNWKSVLRDATINTILQCISSYKQISEEELLFRIKVKENDFPNAFSEFIESTCVKFDQKEKTENTINALQSVVKFIKDYFKITDEMTSSRLYTMIFDNQYDREIEEVYAFFFANIENEVVDRNVWLHCAYCYINLAQINMKYNKNGCTYNPVDDKLIYYIAGQVKMRVKAMTNRTQSDIAYCISEFIQRNNKILHAY